MSTKQTSILLIEDNPGDAQLVKVYLKDAAFKYELFHAETFFEGVESANNNNIELVLLDLSLPDSTGFKTLSQFMEKAPNLPVVVMTGLNNEIVGNQAVKAGAQDYLVKGQFDGKILGRSIRYSLQRFKTNRLLEEKAKELSIQEKRIVKAQEMARFGNWELDMVNHKFTWTDEVFRVFGQKPGSYQPTLSDYINYVIAEDKDKVERFFDSVAKDGKLHKIEHRIILDGQKVKYISLNAQIAYEELNNKFLLIGGIQDITERKLAEEEIINRHLNNRASQLREEMTADMSFHVRTPLSTAVNLLFLLGNTHLSPQQTELVDGLKTSVDDLSMTINNLLNFSLLVSENIKVEDEEFYLKDFLLTIKKVIRIKSDNAQLKLDFVINNMLPEKVVSDQKKLTQVIYNLLDNAIRYTEPEGNITLSVFTKPVQGYETSLTIQVNHTGKGVSAEQIREIENPDILLSGDMDDTKKNQLNLAIVVKLVKMMGGDVEISSKDKKNSSYTINLPIKINPSTPESLLLAPIAPLRILLVEDHFLNQMATKRLLTSWSTLVSVDVAENGLVAVEKFRAHGYDVVLMDIQMPVMNGFESTTRIRQTNDTVPIIALTANASKTESEKCKEMGMNAYISKPFKPQELYDKILQLIRK